MDQTEARIALGIDTPIPDNNLDQADQPNSKRDGSSKNSQKNLHLCEKIWEDGNGPPPTTHPPIW